MRLDSIKLGNSKISKTCGIFDLPTSVCFHNCAGCYAKKAERIYPRVRTFRQRNLDNYNNNPTYWLIQIARDISQAKNKIKTFRIHSSGDFFSNEYIMHWATIVKTFPNIRFYAYTKNQSVLDFTPLTELKNFNLINSITPDGGFNFGKQERLDTLVEQGYTICPDTIADNGKGFCMGGCTICLSNKKVAFKQH